MIPKHVLSELTYDEIGKLDFRAMGNIVLSRAISLSQTVNDELLEPISQWLNDPNFMEKFAILIGSNIPNWAKYKKNQRKWSVYEKSLAAERLKLYWQEIRKKRKYQKDLQIIFGNTNDNNFVIQPMPKIGINISTEFITPIMAPFSQIKRYQAETTRQFIQAQEISLSYLLPWKLMLATELIETDHGSTTFNTIKPFIKDLRSDKIIKFQHLLQMDMDGDIFLKQPDPKSDIQIIRRSTDLDSEITITDQYGTSYEFNWQKLNKAQRNKVIIDAIERKILCRSLDDK